MGSDAVLWLTGADVDIELDASDSWCFSAGTKTYAWACAGASITGGTTATPTLTFTTAGAHRVSCTVTVNGVSNTGYRHVFVFSAASMPVAGSANTGFALSSPPSADTERGGWEFDITLFGDSANIADVREGAKVILFSRDWYGPDEAYIGAQPGRENIKCMGWIAGESIVLNPVEGSAAFSVKGPHHWIEKLTSFIDGVESNAAVPTAWTSMQALTVDKAVWHLLEWRSTVSAVLDFHRSEDTHQAKALQSAQGGLLGQIRANTEPVFVQPRFDRYGRLWCDVEAQIRATGDRAGIPVVLTLTKADWQTIHANRQTTPREARIELSGVYYADGNEPKALFSLSAGHVFKRHGDPVTVERLLLADQAEANTRAGMLLGWHNRLYDFEVKGAANNGMLDIAPVQYIGVDIAAGDTPRGVAFSGNMVPRRVTMQFDPTVGFISYDVVGEQESVTENSVDGDVPPSAVDGDWDNSIPGGIGMPPLPPLDILLPPTTPPTSATPPKEMIIHSSNFGVMYTKNYGQNWYFMNAGLSGVINYSYIENIVVAPNKAIWMLVRDLGDDYLFRASALGGTWALIARGTLDLEGGYITALGVNTNAAEQIAVVSGSGSSDISRLYIGNGGGLSAGSSTFSNRPGTSDALVFYNNNWWVFGSLGGVFATPWGHKFSAAGALLTNGDLNTSVGQDNAARYVAPRPSDFFQWDSSGVTGFNVVTTAFVATRFTTFDPSKNLQGVAFSPTGQRAMGADNTILKTPYKTSDGGSTWSSAAAIIPAGHPYWENCGDDFRWIWAGGNVVRFTWDFGSNYAEIVGDMITTAPLINIRGIRMVSL
jgi:hypothetical protein